MELLLPPSKDDTLVAWSQREHGPSRREASGGCRPCRSVTWIANQGRGGVEIIGVRCVWERGRDAIGDGYDLTGARPSAPCGAGAKGHAAESRTKRGRRTHSHWWREGSTLAGAGRAARGQHRAGVTR